MLYCATVTIVVKLHRKCFKKCQHSLCHTEKNVSIEGVNKKCKIRSKGVVKGLRVLLLKTWDSLHISGTVEARNIKFGTHIDHKVH